MVKEVEVFGRNDGACGYCTMAYKLLEDNNIEYTSYDILQEENKSILMMARGLTSLSGQTIPQVFIDGEYIGGYAELKQFL